MDTSVFKDFVSRHAHGHLVGIGGVSMAPLAEVLKRSLGINVSGSDIRESETVDKLRSLGIKIAIGHDAKNIEGADFVVRTAAARDDNPEIASARAAGIPVYERAEVWGFLMRGYKNSICVSGTHGKTTTTSMITHIFMQAGLDPTVMIGGTLPLLKASHRVGHGDTIIMESCEYYNPFLSFFPTVAVILNIEADHLDFFKDLEDVKKSFRKFASLVPENGLVICNADDKNTMDTVNGIGRNIITFGIENDADVMAKNIECKHGMLNFDVYYRGEKYTSVSMHVPGLHNVKNALAASAAAINGGISPECISQALATFTGAGRRFEYKGSLNGAKVYDDYAHHPGEIHALIDAAKSQDCKRIILCFQPHTYSRTKALFDDFVRELSRADVLYLSEIYAAREQNTIGISSRDLAEKIPGSTYCSSFSELENILRDTARPGDLILTVGAGNIYLVGEALAKK